MIVGAANAAFVETGEQRPARAGRRNGQGQDRAGVNVADLLPGLPAVARPQQAALGGGDEDHAVRAVVGRNRQRVYRRRRADLGYLLPREPVGRGAVETRALGGGIGRVGVGMRHELERLNGIALGAIVGQAPGARASGAHVQAALGSGQHALLVRRARRDGHGEDLLVVQAIVLCVPRPTEVGGHVHPAVRCAHQRQPVLGVLRRKRGGGDAGRGAPKERVAPRGAAVNRYERRRVDGADQQRVVRGKRRRNRRGLNIWRADAAGRPRPGLSTVRRQEQPAQRPRQHGRRSRADGRGRQARDRAAAPLAES